MIFILINYAMLIIASCIFLYHGESQLAIWVLFLLTAEQNIINRYNLDQKDGKSDDNV